LEALGALEVDTSSFVFALLFVRFDDGDAELHPGAKRMGRRGRALDGGVAFRTARRFTLRGSLLVP
jgi:hypothetical protein